jgi:hypothetical protein
MWDPQRLTTLWAFTACYRASFTLLTSWEHNTVEPPLNFPQLKAFPHLMSNFNNPTSIILVLNFLHSYFSQFSVQIHWNLKVGAHCCWFSQETHSFYETQRFLPRSQKPPLNLELNQHPHPHPTLTNFFSKIHFNLTKYSILTYNFLSPLSLRLSHYNFVCIINHLKMPVTICMSFTDVLFMLG